LISNFAEVMAPLYELKEHYRKWRWEVKHEQALQSIKDAVWNSIKNIFLIRQRRRYYLLMRQMWLLDVRSYR
jgi:hypothetical protein